MRKLLLTIIVILLSISMHSQTSTFKFLTDLETKYDYSYSLELQSDGKVLQAGDAWGQPCMVRFDTSGNLDNTFGEGGKVFATWSCGSNPSDNDIKIQQDGKIVFGTSYFNGTDEDFIVARYNSDGTQDVNFGTEGKVIIPIGAYHDRCNAIAIQSDGKIIAGGGTNNAPGSNHEYDFALVRINLDGTIDNAFGNNGIVVTNIGLKNNIAYSVAVQPDNKIILAGEANDSIFSDFALVRYNPDGTLDNSFGNNGIVRTELSSTYDLAKSVILQPNGKILVAGSSQSSLSNDDFAIVRYNPDGTVDINFGVNGAVQTDLGNDYGNDIALQKDGKIILIGSSATGTIYDFAALCYDTLGVLDDSFGNNGVIRTSFGSGDSDGNAVCLKDDGEIIIAGSYNHGSPDYIDFATVRLFSNITPSSIPLLISPINETMGLSTDITFLWNGVYDASSYKLQVSSSYDFNSLVVDQAVINATGYLAIDLISNTTYYWRVNANIGASTGDWSEIWSFSTGTVNVKYEINDDYINIYPVPVQEKLQIDGKELKAYNISIISTKGAILKQVKGFGLTVIDVADLQRGIYLVKISDEKNELNKYIMKE